MKCDSTWKNVANTSGGNNQKHSHSVGSIYSAWKVVLPRGFARDDREGKLCTVS